MPPEARTWLVFRNDMGDYFTNNVYDIGAQWKDYNNAIALANDNSQSFTKELAKAARFTSIPEALRALQKYVTQPEFVKVGLRMWSSDVHLVEVERVDVPSYREVRTLG